jgi:hypothetical protein
MDWMDQRDQWTDIGFSGTKGGTHNRTALAGPLMADCVEKSFLADAKKFSGPLGRLTRGEVGDHADMHDVARHGRVELRSCRIWNRRS